jgi:hypothetical protein
MTMSKLEDGYYIWQHNTEEDIFFPCLIQFGEELYLCGDEIPKDLGYHLQYGTFRELRELLNKDPMEGQRPHGE